MSESSDEKSCLESLKDNYSILKEKYSLPEFSEMNKDFSIEKLSEIESDFLIREIRKIIAERFSGYLRFVEAILNPVNSPMFVFSIMKTLDKSETEKLSDIYKKLTEIEIYNLEVDIEYSEEKEAEFVKTAYRNWQLIKKELLSVAEKIKKNWDNDTDISKKNRGYFG